MAERLKILWIGPDYTNRYNRVHEHLPIAASRIADVTRHSHPVGSAPEVRNIHRLYHQRGPFDAVVVQHPRHCDAYTSIRMIPVPKICIVTDYFDRNYRLKNDFINRHSFDLVAFPETNMMSRAHVFQVTGQLSRTVSCRWLPFWVDTDVFKPLNLAKEYDAMMLYSVSPYGEHPRRRAAMRIVELYSDITTFCRLLTDDNGKVVGDEYVRLINRSRIAVTNNDRHGSVNFKHFEYPACGTLMMTEDAVDFVELGFEPNKHYVQYEEPMELPDLLRFYTRNEPARRKIEEQALEMVRQHHTVMHRARLLLGMIESIL